MASGDSSLLTGSGGSGGGTLFVGSETIGGPLHSTSLHWVSLPQFSIAVESLWSEPFQLRSFAGMLYSMSLDAAFHEKASCSFCDWTQCIGTCVLFVATTIIIKNGQHCTRENGMRSCFVCLKSV